MALSPQTKQKTYIASAILLVIVIIIALIIWRQFGNPTNDTAAIDQSSSSAQTITPTPIPTNLPAPPEVIGYTGQDGRTALQLLRDLYPATQTSGDGVNTAVISINGRPTPDQNKIWNFYLNGQLAQVPPSTYLTTSQDQIEWRLEDF